MESIWLYYALGYFRVLIDNKYSVRKKIGIGTFKRKINCEENEL